MAIDDKYRAVAFASSYAAVQQRVGAAYSGISINARSDR
jgi:hypothetical protein